MRDDLLFWGTYILVFVAGLGMVVINWDVVMKMAQSLHTSGHFHLWTGKKILGWGCRGAMKTRRSLLRRGGVLLCKGRDTRENIYYGIVKILLWDKGAKYSDRKPAEAGYSQSLLVASCFCLFPEAWILNGSVNQQQV